MFSGQCPSQIVCFAHRTTTCKRGGSRDGDAEKHGKSPLEFGFFAFWPQLRRNEAMNILSKSCFVESGLQREGGLVVVMQDGGLTSLTTFGSRNLLKET